MTYKDGSLMHAAQSLIEHLDIDDETDFNWDQAAIAVENLEKAVDEQQAHEELLPILLVGLRHELQKHGRPEARNLLEELLVLLEELVDTPLLRVLSAEQFLSNTPQSEPN